MRTKWIFSGTRGASCSIEFVCRIRQKNRFPRDGAGRSRQAKQPAATTGPLESGKGNYSDASSSPSDVLFTALIHGVGFRKWEVYGFRGVEVPGEAPLSFRVSQLYFSLRMPVEQPRTINYRECGGSSSPLEPMILYLELKEKQKPCGGRRQRGVLTNPTGIVVFFSLFWENMWQVSWNIVWDWARGSLAWKKKRSSAQLFLQSFFSLILCRVFKSHFDPVDIH